jgi:hypothetical protein
MRGHLRIQPVFEALPARSLQILVDGQDQHIFIVDEIEAALFQLAEMGVMDCMGPAPMLVRGQGQDAAQKSYRIVGRMGSEEGPVTTIVLNDEEAHEKTGCQDRQSQAERVGVFQTAVHEIPEQDKGDDTVTELPKTFPQVGDLVLRQMLHQGRRSAHRGVRRLRHIGLSLPGNGQDLPSNVRRLINEHWAYLPHPGPFPKGEGEGIRTSSGPFAP